MKTRLLGVLAILSALTACGGHASSSSARPPLTGAGAVTAKLPTLSTAWSAPATADTVLFRDMDPSRGPSLWTTPDAVVTIAQQQVRSYGLADGKATWTLALPQSVCASSFDVDGGGIGVLGLGTDDHCTTIAAVDTAHGRLLWRTKLDPRLNVYLSSVDRYVGQRSPRGAHRVRSQRGRAALGRRDRRHREVAHDRAAPAGGGHDRPRDRRGGRPTGEAAGMTVRTTA